MRYFFRNLLNLRAYPVESIGARLQAAFWAVAVVGFALLISGCGTGGGGAPAATAQYTYSVEVVGMGSVDVLQPLTVSPGDRVWFTVNPASGWGVVGWSSNCEITGSSLYSHAIVTRDGEVFTVTLTTIF